MFETIESYREKMEIEYSKLDNEYNKAVKELDRLNAQLKLK